MGTIRKNIPYGPSWRHQLDLYLPVVTSADGHRLRVRVPRGGSVGQKTPVVVFISRGGWMIGYKFWGFLMGQLLQKQGVLFITPDYRNFPEVSVGAMVEDVRHAMDWVFANVASLGGDLENVTLMGQSAGAHLSALAMLDHIAEEQNAPRRLDEGPTEMQPQLPNVSWSVRSLRRWVGISGPYDLVDALPKFRERGVPWRVLQSLMENDLLQYSPARRVRDMSVLGQRTALDLLPAIHLFHGTADDTVHWRQSEGFAEILRQAGATVETKYYQNKSHTDPIVEDPIAGAGDELMSDLLQLLIPGSRCGDTVGGWQPKLLLKCAKVINPF